MPNKGNNNSTFAINANAARPAPNDNDPTSPIKRVAGYPLCHKKPNNVPTMIAENVASCAASLHVIEGIHEGITHSDENNKIKKHRAGIKETVARPSSPSV